MRPVANLKPLTDAEFERLGGFLGKGEHRRAMNLEELDGFFTALICDPESVPPSEYSPRIYGGEPCFRDFEEAQDITDLIMRHWNTIAGTLCAGKVCVPFLLKGEAGTAHGNDWAKGFLRGMSLRREHWKRFMDDEQYSGSLVPILILAHEPDPDPKLCSRPITAEQRARLLADLATSVMHVYHYFRPS